MAGVTKAEIAELLHRLNAMWPMRLPSEPRHLVIWIDQWHDALDGFTAAEVNAAVRILATHERHRDFPPSLPAIRAQCLNARHPDRLTADGAWAFTVDIIRRYAAMSDLPPIPDEVRSAVQRAGGWSFLRTANLDTARRAFITAYQTKETSP